MTLTSPWTTRPPSRTHGKEMEATGAYDETMGKVKFIAEGGHAYEIYSGKNDDRLRPWVIDTTTGKVVAGEKPPDFD